MVWSADAAGGSPPVGGQAAFRRISDLLEMCYKKGLSNLTDLFDIGCIVLVLSTDTLSDTQVCQDVKENCFPSLCLFHPQTPSLYKRGGIKGGEFIILLI